jgi:uroporphyrinogen-III synthase
VLHAQVAAQLRAGVEAATRLTCSVGIAPNATLAKVASDLNKPNGQALVVSSREAVMAFVHDLPIRKVSGTCICCGAVTAVCLCPCWLDWRPGNVSRFLASST